MKTNSIIVIAILIATTCSLQKVNAQWSLNGNTLTGEKKLGTLNSYPLQFYTQGAERMRIDTTGKLGIGTMLPLQKLDINGNINIGTNSGLYIGNRRVLSINGTGNFFAGQEAGISNTGSYNTATGFNALQKSTSGDNTANGYNALFANTTGFDNTAIGTSGLSYNTTGNYNTAIGSLSLLLNNGSNNTASGYAALISNTTGLYNTANGANALFANTYGSYNTSIGESTLYHNTTGNYNTANGYNALFSNTNGSNNTANGYVALFKNVGSYNTAGGSQSLYNNTTGWENSAYGYGSLNANTTGSNNTAFGSNALSVNTASENTAVGRNALFVNTTGTYNTALGDIAMSGNTTGFFNTAAGAGALGRNTTGYENTVVGELALYNNITGSSNTAIGYAADVSLSNFTNATAIGALAIVNASNKIRFGNSSVTVIEGNVPYTVSDKRFKTNIHEGVKGLAFINKLQPVIYNFQAREFDEFLMKDMSKAKRDSALSNLDYKEAENLHRSGFIAQDVEKAAKETGYDFDGVHAPKDDNDNYSLSYTELVVPLVKAVQELSAQNDSLKSRLDKIEQVLIANKQETSVSNVAVAFTSAQLEQNIPNPLTHSTSIHYNIPAGSKNAQIIVTDFTGKTIKQVAVNKAGAGEINIDASALSNGTYAYSLVIDGKTIISKKMVVAK